MFKESNYTLFLIFKMAALEIKGLLSWEKILQHWTACLIVGLDFMAYQSL